MRSLVGDTADEVRIELTTSTADRGQRYALVLDDESGGLEAAAIISLQRRAATLERLAFAHDRDTAIERRMIGVAEAIREAFGCERLVVQHAA